MSDTLEQKKITDVLEDFPNRLVLSSLRDKDYLYKKTVIQKIKIGRAHV